MKRIRKNDGFVIGRTAKKAALSGLASSVLAFL
jgi:hypothetical protein